ncbi:MAG: VirD4-like conjugal transfer protein, CD1115 family [Peptococcia bacterium]|jgi:type IV secretion system protein VirD4
MTLTEQEKRARRLKTNLFLLALGYLLFAFVTLHISNAFINIEIVDLESINKATENAFQHMQNKPIFIPTKQSLKHLLFFSVFYFVMVAYYLTTRKKFMAGKEHGSAQWASKNEIKQLIDENDDKNVIFTQTERMSLDTRKTGKNLNMLIVGSPGTGKTRYFAKPNILQANTSFVITDPKGELLRDTACFLIEKGYRLKVFNLIEMEYSDGYNPFEYIKQERDVLIAIDVLIKNTTPEESKSYDPFWEKAEIAFLQALMFFIWYELPKNEQNFATMLELLRKAEIREDEEDYESDLDLIFKQLAREKPDHIALKQYAIFKQAAGKTAKSILISAGVRLSVFNIQALADLTSHDTLELETLGDEKTALFVIISDSISTFNFLVTMMYTQLFHTLYHAADFKYEGRLPYHVRFILDEFANIGQIPEFDKLVGTMRSREVSVSIIIQNIAQLSNLYENSWETIIGNCDSLLFLGGKDWNTLEYISKALGEETIDAVVYNKTKEPRWQFSTSINYDILARELMKPDELGRMPNSDCVLLIRGLNPFYSKKFKLESHKNYKYLYDSSDRYYFDYRNVRGVKSYKRGEFASEPWFEHEDDFFREKSLTGDHAKMQHLTRRLLKVDKK